MQARQLRRARGSHRSFDRPRPYLPSTGPGVRYPALLTFDRPRGATDPSTGPGLCVVPGVPGLTSYAWYSALPSTPPLMCSARGALLCLRAVLCFASTGPGVLRQPPGVLTCLCLALPHFDTPPLCFASTAPGLTFDTPRGALLCFASTPPGGALLACFALLCFACFAYVFPTHTEGGDPGSLHEKKIKTKEF